MVKAQRSKELLYDRQRQPTTSQVARAAGSRFHPDDDRRVSRCARFNAILRSYQQRDFFCAVGISTGVARQTISLDGAILTGSRNARLALIEYSDLECPFCARLDREVMPNIIRTYVDTGKLMLAFRHLPIESQHPNALMAASALECAAAQGHFWTVRGPFFALPKPLSYAKLKEVAVQHGLDSSALDQCIEGDTKQKIRQDILHASTLGIRRTPTLILGSIERDNQVRIGTIIGGLPTDDRLDAAIDEALKRIR